MICKCMHFMFIILNYCFSAIFASICTSNIEKCILHLHLYEINHLSHSRNSLMHYNDFYFYMANETITMYLYFDVATHQKGNIRSIKWITQHEQILSTLPQRLSDSSYVMQTYIPIILLNKCISTDYIIATVMHGFFACMYFFANFVFFFF